MKKVIFFVIIMLTKLVVAQSATPEVKLAVLGPELSIEGLNVGHMKKIQTKVQRMISRYGIVSTDYINDFIIYPEFEIYVDDAIEGTYGKNYDIEAELTLKAKNIKTGALIATPFPFELKGVSRDSRNDAITKAIGKISSQEPGVQEFIEDLKQKILSHYESNCSQICSDAAKLISLGANEEAITLLYSIPDGLSSTCYNKVETLLDQAYLRYNAQQCNELIAEAQGAIKNKEVEYAQSLLNMIGANTSCYDEAQRILNSLENIDAKESNPIQVKEKISNRKQNVVKKVSKIEAKKDDKELLCAKRLRTVGCD